MLSKDDNELLCRVGRGTPMGELLRQYWMPGLPSSELPSPDGPPKKVRLLGEDLVAFRDTGGRVGVLGSGGLSHFVVDEALDRHVLEILAKRDADAVAALPLEQLNSGNSEIRNWIAAAGALEGLTMRLVDYVPCYRSEAGTGCGMAFAVWD